MASSRSSVIQFNDEQDAQSELKFQDFSHDKSSVGAATLSPSSSYTTFPESADLNLETEDLLGEEKKQSSSVWEFSYYQSFFDVDTDQVLQRALWSMIPVTGRATFLDRHIRSKPDLYGPIWITATLILSITICGNIRNYLSVDQELNIPYNVQKVSLAATVLYSYTFLWPIFLWGFIWYRQRSNGCSLMETICVYGYSLTIFVPISFFWIIQVTWLEVTLVIIGMLLSCAVLLQVFWPILKQDSVKIAAIALCLILLVHVLIGGLFMGYFFTATARSAPVSPATPFVVPTSAPILPPASSNASSAPAKVSRSAAAASPRGPEESPPGGTAFLTERNRTSAYSDVIIASDGAKL